MSDEVTTNNLPTDPILCKMGCGFFGNGAHNGYCSKCYREHHKDKASKGSASESTIGLQSPHKNPLNEHQPRCEECICSQVAVESSMSATPKKKKSKKSSFKALMAGAMQSSSPERDVRKEKELLRNVTGGGAFTKIEKI